MDGPNPARAGAIALSVDRPEETSGKASANYFLTNPRLRIAGAVGEGAILQWQNAPPAQSLSKASTCNTCEREDLPRKAGGWSELFAHTATRFWVLFASHQLLRLTPEAEQHVIRKSRYKTAKTQYILQGANMAKLAVRNKKAPSRRPWSKGDLRLLKGMARKESLAKIAQTLKRTVGATRQKATNIGVSLRLAPKKGAPAKKG